MHRTLADYGLRAEQAAVSSAGQLLFDAPAVKTKHEEDEKLTLERHFNDLYAVFMHKVTAFALQPAVSKEETARLRTFFDELLKAREALGQ